MIPLVAIICTSCGMNKKITRATQYAKMYEEKPHTLLVMPPINNSSNERFLTSFIFLASSIVFL